MLILRRKSGESIVIGDNIVVTVLDINEGSVRLAIDAPKVIPILRSELLQAADANRDSAVTEHSQSQDLLRFLGGKSGPGQSRPRAVRPGSASWRPAARAVPAAEGAQSIKPGTAETEQAAKPDAAETEQTVKPKAAEAEQTVKPEAVETEQSAKPEAAETEQGAKPE